MNGQGELAGRVAVVSGAARGIGRGIAARFASAGAQVALIDALPAVHEAAEAIRSAGGSARASVPILQRKMS